ncbi:hypothetical protein STEG23_035003 [Scotinomys teguina]
MDEERARLASKQWSRLQFLTSRFLLSTHLPSVMVCDQDTYMKRSPFSPTVLSIVVFTKAVERIGFLCAALAVLEITL